MSGRIYDGAFTTPVAVSQERWIFPFPDNPTTIIQQDFEVLASHYRRTPISQQHSAHPGFYLVEERLGATNWAGILRFTQVYSQIPQTRSEFESYAYTFPGIAPDSVANPSYAVTGQIYGSPNDSISCDPALGASPGDVVAIDWDAQVGGTTYGGTITRTVASGGGGNISFPRHRFEYWNGSATQTLDPNYTQVRLGSLGRDPVTRIVQSEVRFSYFLPGVSAGINSHADIALSQPFTIMSDAGKETDTYSDTTTPSKVAYEQLVSTGAKIVVEGSVARRWRGEIYERATRYVVAE
jgi:hypothetical protein